jgi:rhodanese-related sulfurtransferase
MAKSRLAELPRDREIWLNCGVGQRSYYALRVLLQHGFKAKTLSAGFTTSKAFLKRELNLQPDSKE